MISAGLGKRRLTSAVLPLCLAFLLAGCFIGPITIATPSMEATPELDDSPIAQAPPTPRATPSTRPTPSVAPSATAAPSGKVGPRASEPTQFVPSPPSNRNLFLAPIGNFPADLVEEVATFYEKELGIDIEVLAPSPLDPAAFDSVRDQYVAEDLVDALVIAYPKATADQGNLIIGLLPDDLYIRDRPDWNWAFGLRQNRRYAVVSTARMGRLEEPIASIVKSRLRKMVLRDIGVLYYRLPLNRDPLSVLYVDVLGVDDLDRMSEALCGSDCPGTAHVPSVAAAVPVRSWLDSMPD